MGSWLFRVASSPAAGGGHVARCLVLADALRGHGEDVTFALDADGAGWGRILDEHGFPWQVGTDLPDRSWDGCLADGYRFSASEWRRLRDLADILASIVDDQPVPDFLDLVIAPARHQADRQEVARYAHGLPYALVNPAYADAAAAGPRQEVRRLLVTFGLRDSVNATGLVLEAVERLDADIAVVVALGRDAPHLDAIRAKIDRLPGASLLVDAPLAELMSGFDMVVGSGGVGLLERCAAGLPSITITIAANQVVQAEAIARGGGTRLLGGHQSVTPSAVAVEIPALSLDFAARKRMSEAARRLVDGRGAERVAGIMIEMLRQEKVQ
jgi:UDP-2,4-diacetamido-2,4,6-trideoxy-beta-L-altropyranose hydrolase